MSYENNITFVTRYMKERQEELLRLSEEIRLSRELASARGPVLPHLTCSLGRALVSAGQWLMAHPAMR